MRSLIALKRQFHRLQASSNPAARNIYKGITILYSAINGTFCFLTDSSYRAVLFMQLFNSKNVHQTTPLTGMNRYPEIFSACQNYLKNKKNLKILSFGCSTGEEVLTLRQYFPDAEIVGVEINKRSLKICQKHAVDKRVRFLYSTEKNIRRYGPYDAIFCMAVLQRRPHDIAAKGIENLSKIYPFEKFEQQIKQLDDHLNNEGLLILHMSPYLLTDTSVAGKYVEYGDCNQNDYISSFFNKASQKIDVFGTVKSVYLKSNNTHLHSLGY